MCAYVSVHNFTMHSVMLSSSMYIVLLVLKMIHHVHVHIRMTVAHGYAMFRLGLMIYNVHFCFKPINCHINSFCVTVKQLDKISAVQQASIDLTFLELGIDDR